MGYENLRRSPLAVALGNKADMSPGSRLKVAFVAVQLNFRSQHLQIAASVALRVELNRIRRVQIHGETPPTTRFLQGANIPTPVHSVTPREVLGQPLKIW